MAGHVHLVGSIGLDTVGDVFATVGRLLGPYLKRVPDGELGEIVVTRFNSIFYLIRFGTGDLSRLIPTPCSCGRTSFKLAGIFGRVGDAVKVRGMFVAPSQLAAVRRRFDDMPIQARVSRHKDRDYLTIKMESDKSGDAQAALVEAFDKIFREICTVKIDKIEVVARGVLEAEKLIIDERNWKQI